MKFFLLFSLLPILFSLTGAPGTYPGFDEFRPVVYPNPATDYISLSDDESVTELVIYNFSGRQVCSFKASSGQKYNISRLPTGMYLVQFIDQNHHVFHTQRLHKR